MSIRLSWLDEAQLALGTIAERAIEARRPALRIGVTGLARSGKTVFLTALAQALLHGARLPVFEAYHRGRIARTEIAHQPDPAVPRFDVESHMAALRDKRVWPQSTRRIAQMRLTIHYESASFLSRNLGSGRLHLDFVDYPGEWLLDLPLLRLSYDDWCRQVAERAALPHHVAAARPWQEWAAAVGPESAADEATAKAGHEAFLLYLRALRADADNVAVLPPGRFLMPGDLEGSPALTFAPLLPSAGSWNARQDPLRALLQRRFEAYKSHVVKPFFRDHFSRLDRQIVLVDLLSALDAGPHALGDLQSALSDILDCFRPGALSWLTKLVDRRIDKVLFAATKADHLHHTDHDRMEAILDRLVARAAVRVEHAGAARETLALAALRATREAYGKQNGERLPLIVGTPLPGQSLKGPEGSRHFDGEAEVAFFPGDLPADPEAVFSGWQPDPESIAVRHLRFRPPPLSQQSVSRLATGGKTQTSPLPHIRLDRALQFLVGDALA